MLPAVRAGLVMNESHDEQRSKGRAWVRAGLIALFLAGAAVLAWRGPMRAQRISSDLVIIYSSARAWLAGENPYDDTAAAIEWLNGGGPPEANPGSLGSAVLLYPPTTFPLLGPIAMMGWEGAAAAWAAVSTVLYAAAVLSVAAVAGLRWGSTGWWGFLAGAAWLAPAATNLALGQLAIAAVGLVAIGRAQAESRDGGARPGRWAEGMAGFFAGIAAALKPQVAGLFVVYDGGRGRWVRVAGAALAVALAAAAGIGRLERSNIAWWASWTRNLEAFTTTSNGDPTRINPLAFQIISLHYPLHAFTDDRVLVKWIVYGIVGALCAAYFVIDLKRGRRRGEGRGELLSLSMVAVVSLMVVYHRFYDAVLLLWPLALAVRGIAERRLAAASWVLLGLMAAFLAPGAAVLGVLGLEGKIPAAIERNLLWQAVVLPHEAWALLGMAVVLVWMRTRVRAE